MHQYNTRRWEGREGENWDSPLDGQSLISQDGLDGLPTEPRKVREPKDRLHVILEPCNRLGIYARRNISSTRIRADDNGTGRTSWVSAPEDPFPFFFLSFLSDRFGIARFEEGPGFHHFVSRDFRSDGRS
jgi:hypothetical protein